MDPRRPIPDKILDEILTIATKESYLGIRTPGKFEYDVSKGDCDVEQDKKEIKERFKASLARFRKYCDFSDEQLEAYK